MLQDGNQLAIVTAAKCEAGRGKADGLTVCELTWMIIAGDQSGQSPNAVFLRRPAATQADGRLSAAWPSGERPGGGRQGA